MEIACENVNTCTTDMLSFKGYIHRWLTSMTKIAPFTADIVLPVLKTSAEAAVRQCTGGETGRACGFKWASGKYDGITGVGQTMNVLGAVSSLLTQKVPTPATSDTGGTSKGDSNAGSNGDDFQNHNRPLKTGDKAGAGIITFLVLASACGMFGWMSFGA